jgi:hypothetical protein
MQNSKTTLTPPRKNILKVILSTFVALLFLAAISLAALPSILSTSWGNEKITQWLNSQISGTVAFKKLHVSWSGGQKIEQLQLLDSQGKAIVNLESASADTPLWKFLRLRALGGNLEISGLNADIIQEANGLTNIERALTKKENLKPTVISGLANLAIKLNDVQASVVVDEEQTSHINLAGKTIQGSLQGSFNLNASIGKISKDLLFSDPHRLNTDQMGKVKIQAHANNFPVSLLDEALALSNLRYKGLLLAALGEKLDLNLQESKGMDGIDLKLNVQTPLLHGKLNGTLKEDRLVVNESDSIEMILQPKLVELISQLISSPYNIQLKRDTKGRLNLSKMNLVFDLEGGNKPLINLANTHILASFVVDQADLKISDPVGDISLQKLNLQLDASDQSDKIVLTLDSQATRNNAITQISVKGLLQKSFKSEELSSLKNAEFALDLKGLPIMLVDEMFGHSKLLVDALGKSVDAQASFIYKDTPLVSLQLNSDVIKMDPIQFKLNPEILLLKPAKIQYELPSSVVNNFALKDSSIKLQDKAILQIHLKKLQFPFSALQSEEPLKALSKSVIAVDFAIDQIHLNSSSSIGEFHLSEITANITGDSLANSQAALQAKVMPAKNNIRLQQLLGLETKLQLQALFGMHLDGIKIHDFNGEIKSEIAHAKLSGRLENFEKLLLTSPATMRYNLSPAAIQILGLNRLALDDASQIYIHIDADKNGIHLVDLSKLQLKGLIKIDQINLYGNAGSIQQFALPWQINVPEQLMNLRVKGLTKLNGGRVEGSIDGQVQLSHWMREGELNFSKASLDSQMKVVNFPTAFLEKMSGQEDLVSLIGQTMDIDFSTKFSSVEKLDGNLEIAAKATGLKGHGAFKIENGVVINPSGQLAMLNLTLTPERFQVLRKRFLVQNKQYPDIVLTAPAQITLNISSLSYPLEGSDAPHWLKASIQSNLSIDSLGIKNRSNGRHVWLRNIQGTLESPELAKNLSFNFKGQHHQEGGDPLPFSVNGRADHAFKNSGEFDMDNLAFWLDTKFQKFPVMLLGQFLSVDDAISQRISAVLGDTVNADVHVQIDHLQGPVIANLSGDKGSISLDAKINKGILFLNKNFQTQVALTPEFGKAILEDIFPLAKGVIGSDNPLTINIAAEGFSLPIKNFDINNVKIGSSSLELGKVRFRSDGQLGTILSLFNTSGSDVINVWFTPLYVNMQDGVVSFQRMDMLIMDTYPIATWGQVSLAKDKVNMIIGLSGKALFKGFNIQGLGYDYMLQIPYKGPISNASFDKKKATAKIAALIASNRGPEGLLIGTALHIASGGLMEEKAPPPTTNPLPWSTGEESSSSASQMESTHPLHQMEEKASAILRNLVPF